MRFEISEKEYDTHCEKYNDLGENIQSSLKILLKDAGISFLDVNYRIKGYNSFLDKIERKEYPNPLEDNEDFCGMRIICYFPSDIEKIREVIKKEFIVHHFEDKSDKEIDRFGYRSYHFIVSVKNEWLSVPSFRNLKGVKAEIQVRTILMHAWADIEHKLQYKKKEHIPKVIQRKFYQLSALFELADEQFEVLRNKKEEVYKSSLPEHSTEFDTKQEMNVDTLQAFLDIHFAQRVKSEKLTAKLLDELLKYQISFDDLENMLKKFSPEEIDSLERELKSFLEEGKMNGWVQVGAIRFLLDITNDEYWNRRKGHHTKQSKEIKEIFRERYKDKKSM
ncbi:MULTISPECIES: GTP pyrophosphokinase [Bacillus cereus group]|uniref:GTP pyrophosphokinase n=1 Tax=Bacillus cereus group TaxID=86661 RepID=UPI0005CA46D1|nr:MULTISPECIES: hypothetical protein [Bacillus cereus group]KIZ27230.1 hypothetical protein SK30_27300 [Bacillus cereus]